MSAQVGKRTTVIFQLFGGQQGLIDAAFDHAGEDALRRRDVLLTDIGGFPRDPAVLAELIANYVGAADACATEVLSDHFLTSTQLRRDLICCGLVNRGDRDGN